MSTLMVTFVEGATLKVHPDAPHGLTQATLEQIGVGSVPS
jgi:hypothetical protein